MSRLVKGDVLISGVSLDCIEGFHCMIYINEVYVYEYSTCV